MNDPADQALEDLLRRDFKGAVADDGFAARVTRSLPPVRRRQPWLIPAAALGGALLSWLALRPSPVFELAGREWLAGATGPASTLVLSLLLVMGLLGSVWALDEAP
jgi:hypothetical protein